MTTADASILLRLWTQKAVVWCLGTVPTNVDALAVAIEKDARPPVDTSVRLMKDKQLSYPLMNNVIAYWDGMSRSAEPLVSLLTDAALFHEKYRDEVLSTLSWKVGYDQKIPADFIDLEQAFHAILNRSWRHDFLSIQLLEYWIYAETFAEVISKFARISYERLRWDPWMAKFEGQFVGHVRAGWGWFDPYQAQTIFADREASTSQHLVADIIRAERRVARQVRTIKANVVAEGLRTNLNGTFSHELIYQELDSPRFYSKWGLNWQNDASVLHYIIKNQRIAYFDDLEDILQRPRPELSGEWTHWSEMPQWKQWTQQHHI